MYRNLKAECARRDVTQMELARMLHIQRGTLSKKLKRKNGFKLQEAFKIKEYLNSDLPMEELFEFDSNIREETNRPLKMVNEV